MAVFICRGQQSDDHGLSHFPWDNAKDEKLHGKILPWFPVLALARWKSKTKKPRQMKLPPKKQRGVLVFWFCGLIRNSLSDCNSLTMSLLYNWIYAKIVIQCSGFTSERFGS
jgi:hypothetical protein